MASWGETLTDPALDALLMRDGFVLFRLVSPERAGELREAFGNSRGWDGHGFSTEFTIDDQELRRSVASEVGSVVDDAIRGSFNGFEPFLHNFLVKYPGEDSNRHVHRDWMFVDERAGQRSYVVWVALEDVTGHNGQLRVLRGSHRLDPMYRGTNLVAPWLRHTDVIEERLLSVPVRAGECVVFDNQLVHGSFPNYTDVPRIAAAIAVRPVGSKLVHYRRSGPDRATRYDVDETFVWTVLPEELLEAPPDIDPVAEVPVEEIDLTGSQLAKLLDSGLHGRSDKLRRSIRSVRKAVAAKIHARRTPFRSIVGNVAHDVPLMSTPGGRPIPRRTFEALHAVRSASGRFPELVERLPTTAATWALRANEALIKRLGPETPNVWDPAEFAWTGDIEARFPEIRAEVDALLEGPSEIPRIEEVTGGIPQGNVGPWRSFVLMHQGRWMDWNCERCPRTTEAVRNVPGLTMAGFSVLEPGTHITEHRGPNKGGLRYQLGVIVPGNPGDCRIRVGDEMLLWREGEGLMFDFTSMHEAWNDSDGIRVLLMLEVIMPLPWYLAGTNRLAQRAMGWFPTTRDMTARLKRLEPHLQRADPDQTAPNR